MSKTESLYFRTNLSATNLDKMKDFRQKVVNLSRELEGLGDSRELSLAFTHLEECLFYVIKHLSLTDSKAGKEVV